MRRVFCGICVLAHAAERTSAASLPCDVFASGGTPCVAAHSTVRALFATYSGALYEVTRASDGASRNVTALSAGGFADSAAQDAFCATTDCVISMIWDQSAFANHLSVGPGGGARPNPDKPVNASRLAVTVGGHKVYGAYFEGGMGYRIDNTTGVALGNASETIYMVTQGTHANAGCCFDYGNAEANNHDDGRGTMEALNFGTSNNSHWCMGAGAGPHVMVDLENGLWAGNCMGVNPQNTPLPFPFVTAMAKGGRPGGGFALKGGDATAAGLKTMYEGPYPPRYSMKKRGSIILGIGGDNSNGSQGSFFEGALTAGYSSDATDAALQASIALTGWGQ